MVDIQSATAEIKRGEKEERRRRKKPQSKNMMASPIPYGGHNKLLEHGPMPNVMAAEPNIGGALCESSVIPFLVPRRKVWLTPDARVPCSNADNIRERKTWTQSDFCNWQNSVRGRELPKMYI